MAQVLSHPLRLVIETESKTARRTPPHRTASIAPVTENRELTCLERVERVEPDGTQSNLDQQKLPGELLKSSSV